jgi:Tfp pilus assembly protein FimT
MKKVAIMGIAALMLSAAIPAFAEESRQEQVICQLAAKNCLNESEAIQKKMKKVRSDIDKGTKVYSAEDIKKIEQKLKEANDLLDNLKGTAPAK